MVDIDNDTMIRMLAEENSKDWEHDSVEVETVRSVLQAADEGKITLRAYTSDRPPKTISARGSAISNEAIADFLGANWSHQKVASCTTALRDLGDGVNVLEGIGPDLAVSIIRAAKATGPSPPGGCRDRTRPARRRRVAARGRRSPPRRQALSAPVRSS